MPSRSFLTTLLYLICIDLLIDQAIKHGTSLKYNFHSAIYMLDTREQTSDFYICTLWNLQVELTICFLFYIDILVFYVTLPVF